MTSFRPLTRTVAVVVVLGVSRTLLIGCSRTDCKRAEDCVNSAESEALGRCGPKDFVCDDGDCRVSCTSTCTVPNVARTTNPCSDDALCTLSARQATRESVEARCTRAPIPCTIPDDCPFYLPGDGAWSCEQGTCRFPGFRYAFED